MRARFFFIALFLYNFVNAQVTAIDSAVPKLLVIAGILSNEAAPQYCTDYFKTTFQTEQGEFFFVLNKDKNLLTLKKGGRDMFTFSVLRENFLSVDGDFSEERLKNKNLENYFKIVDEIDIDLFEQETIAQAKSYREERDAFRDELLSFYLLLKDCIEKRTIYKNEEFFFISDKLEKLQKERGCGNDFEAERSFIASQKTLLLKSFDRLKDKKFLKDERRVTGL